MFVDQSKYRVYYIWIKYKCTLTTVYVQNISLKFVINAVRKNILLSEIDRLEEYSYKESDK